MDMFSQQVTIATRSRVPSLRAIGCWLFLVTAALLLTVPVIAQVSGYTPKPLGENRHLAEAPKPPGNLDELMKWPRQADAWLADHFGLRDRMVTANANIRYSLFGSLTSRQLTRGKDGFIFLNSHSADNPNSAILSLCGVPPWGNAPLASLPGFTRFLAEIRARHPNSQYVLVPSRVTLYPEKLPDWLQETCAPFRQSVPAALEVLRQRSPDADMVFYPLDLFRQRKETHQVYPPEQFHWIGETPRWMAQWIAENRFGRQRLRTIAARPVRTASDLQHFMPGLKREVDGLEMDYAGAGVEKCVTHGCYPELNGLADRLLDVTRYRSQEPGPRLLMLTDSFGNFAAGYFAEYYGEVRHVAVNHMLQLKPEERRELIRALYEDYAPDDVLFLFHDGSLQMSPMVREWVFG